MKYFRCFDLLLTGLHNAGFERWPRVDLSSGRPGRFHVFLISWRGCCVYMGWPLVFTNDTCFSGCEMCSCQWNVHYVNLIGRLLSAPRGWTDGGQCNWALVVSRAGLMAGYINPSPARLWETLWELLWANTFRLFQKIWFNSVTR